MWQTGTYLGHRRLWLSTSLLLCVSIPHDAETLISCGMSVYVEMLFHDYRKYRRMLVVHCNNLDWCHHCEDSDKTLLGTVQQNWAGWTDWYIGDGDSLCTTSGFPPRLCIFFPWITPLLIIPYLRTWYLPKAFHSCWGLAEPSGWRGGMKWVLGVHHQAGAFSFFHQKLCFNFDWQRE